MRSNIKYSGLGTYTKRSKNIKFGKISIAFRYGRVSGGSHCRK